MSEMSSVEFSVAEASSFATRLLVAIDWGLIWAMVASSSFTEFWRGAVASSIFASIVPMIFFVLSSSMVDIESVMSFLTFDVLATMVCISSAILSSIAAVERSAFLRVGMSPVGAAEN